jgi:hypothetical protein
MFISINSALINLIVACVRSWISHSELRLSSIQQGCWTTGLVKNMIEAQVVLKQTRRVRTTLYKNTLTVYAHGSG